MESILVYMVPFGIPKWFHGQPFGVILANFFDAGGNEKYDSRAGESTVLTFLLKPTLGTVLGSAFEVKLVACVTLEGQSADEWGAKTGTHF